jgi:hypothetical protein
VYQGVFSRRQMNNGSSRFLVGENIGTFPYSEENE